MEDTSIYRQRRLRNLRRQLAAERAIGIPLVLVLVGIIFYVARSADRVCFIEVDPEHKIAVQNQETADRIIQRLQEEDRGSVPRRDIWLDPKPKVSIGRRRDATVLTEEAAFAQLRAVVKVKARASILFIEGRPVLAMLTPEDVDRVLDGIIEKFTGNERDLAKPPEPHFAEDYKIASETRDPSAIEMSRENAQRRLLADRSKDVVEIVAAPGDLEKLLNKHKVTRERLAELNPTLDLDHLQPGDKLLIRPGAAVLNLEYVVKKTDILNIPYKTRVQRDPSLAPGQRRTVVVGKNGKKQVVSNLTKHNDRVVARRIISEQPLAQPQDEVIAIHGTPEGEDRGTQGE